MAQLNIRVKNNKLDDTLNYLLQYFGKVYESTILVNDVLTPNPITKQQTVEELLENQVRVIYQQYDKDNKLKTFSETILIEDNIG